MPMSNEPFVYDGTYAQAYEILISHERGYSNNSADRGGRTIDGIAERFHPEAFATAYRLYQAGDTEAFEAFKFDFYKREFWDKNNIGEIADYGERFAAFDIAVNSGGNTSERLLDRAIGNDGVLGEGEMGQRQRANYDRIVAADPRQAVFINGWHNRADNLVEISGLTRQFWNARDQRYFDELMGATEVAKGDPWQLVERSEVNYVDPVSASRARLLMNQETLKLFMQPRLGEMDPQEAEAKLAEYEATIEAGEVEEGFFTWIHRNTITEAIDGALNDIGESVFEQDATTLEGGLHVLDVVNQVVNDMDLPDWQAAKMKYALARELGIEAENMLIVHYDAQPGEEGGHRIGILYFSPEDTRQYYVLNGSETLVNETEFIAENEVPWGGYNENVAVYSPNFDNDFGTYINDPEETLVAENTGAKPETLEI